MIVIPSGDTKDKPISGEGVAAFVDKYEVESNHPESGQRVRLQLSLYSNPENEADINALLRGIGLTERVRVLPASLLPPTIDWAKCDVVEVVEGRCGGRPTILGHRLEPHQLLAEYDSWREAGHSHSRATQETLRAYPYIAESKLERLLDFRYFNSTNPKSTSFCS